MSVMFTDSQRAPYVSHIHPFTNSSSCQPPLHHSHTALQVSHVPPIQKDFPISMPLHSQIGPSVSRTPMLDMSLPFKDRTSCQLYPSSFKDSAQCQPCSPIHRWQSISAMFITFTNCTPCQLCPSLSQTETLHSQTVPPC